METPPPSTHKSTAGSPNSCCSFQLNRFTGRHLTAFEIEKHKAELKLQQMVNRYNDEFHMLKGAISAVKILREEYLCLAAENLQLEAAVGEKEKGESSVVRIKSVSDINSPSGSGSGSEVLTGSGSGSGSDKAKGSTAPTPKCISIRSRGYLANTPPIPGGAHRLRLPVPPALQGSENEASEVEVEVEVDVYNQGTEKTELCNKWGETGSCPYKDRCRFAHGMEEMKPVIRHPRYKTQLCRMMGSGGSCPYGHRCHFRHALGTPKP